MQPLHLTFLTHPGYTKSVLKFLIFLCLLVIITFGAPFIGFGKNLNAVCADAARMFGIDENEYRVEFVKKVVNASGEAVNGTFNISFEDSETGEYIIRIQKSPISRTFTVGVIFHEFAHAAQHKYKLKLDGYTREQHAEMLAFNMMWRSGYWWNGVHMLMLHTLNAKPVDYRVSKQLWNIAASGNNSFLEVPNAIKI